MKTGTSQHTWILTHVDRYRDTYECKDCGLRLSAYDGESIEHAVAIRNPPDCDECQVIMVHNE